jgi:hypothetical protein
MNQKDAHDAIDEIQALQLEMQAKSISVATEILEQKEKLRGSSDCYELFKLGVNLGISAGRSMQRAADLGEKRNQLLENLGQQVQKAKRGRPRKPVPLSLDYSIPETDRRPISKKDKRLFRQAMQALKKSENEKPKREKDFFILLAVEVAKLAFNKKETKWALVELRKNWRELKKDPLAKKFDERRISEIKKNMSQEDLAQIEQSAPEFAARWFKKKT